MLPTKFQDIVWMLGLLHFDQVFIKPIFIKPIGGRLENSGRTEVHNYVDIKWTC